MLDWILKRERFLKDRKRSLSLFNLNITFEESFLYFLGIPGYK